ncbi:MAG: hypothetical protein SGPRY_003210 [Prymnesium sp.]
MQGGGGRYVTVRRAARGFRDETIFLLRRLLLRFLMSRGPPALAASFCDAASSITASTQQANLCVPLFVFLPGYLQLDRLQRELSAMQLVRFGVRCLELVRREVREQPSQSNLFSLLIDMEHSEVVLPTVKWASRSDQRWLPIRVLSDIISIGQQYYSEQILRLFVVNAPLVFPRMWMLVRPFLSESTRE